MSPPDFAAYGQPNSAQATAPGPPSSPTSAAVGSPSAGMSEAVGPGASSPGWQTTEGGPPAPPSVSLPQGGGAVRDIGEKFSVSAATGTAALTIPVATSPGRAGFGPSLSLSYDSGNGNGP